MKISPKQQEEIDFLSKCYRKFRTRKKEREDYIMETVMGKKVVRSNVWQERNRLSEAKRSLDIMVKMWREDLTVGLISTDELMNEWNNAYWHKVVNSIIKSVTPEYRRKTMPGKACTILAFTNFPDIYEAN